MKKKTLAFLLSACLLTQSAGFVSAADFSAVPEEAANAEEIFSPEANPTDSDPSDNLSATGGDDFSDEHPDHMTTTDSGAASEESKISSDLDADTNPDSTTNTESAPSVSDSVTNPETDQDVELLPEETMPEDVELEPEASSTENDSELSQELLFDDGESDTFNDGNDSSSAAFASSKIPDHDIWLADTVKTGLVVDGKNIQTKSLYNLITQPSVKPVYQELGERILSNKPMLVLSSIWKGVIKQEFYDDQKLIYEALLADYLQFVDSTDSKDFDSSQIERANSYLIKMFNDLSTYYTQNGVYNWKPEDFMKLDAEEANKLLQSVDSMKTAVSLVGDACSTTKELVELCTKVNAFKNAADERILLIQKARDAGSSNTAFVEACDAILAQLGSQSIDVSYLRSQSASAAMKKCTETMISELSKQNPALKALSYGSSAMDILFNTSSINSDNLKLSLLYTMDCYFNTALTSSSYTYTRYKNTENANTFVKCFQGYTTFQIFANNIAKSYISGVTSGGALNRAFADIFYREGVKNAESWKNLCDGQINIRRGILDVLAKFYQLYNRFYLKDEYTNALKDQITATPTPTPRPLVPVDYEVTVPESKNPVKEKSSGSSSVKWTLFENGNLFFYGEGSINADNDIRRIVTGSGAQYSQFIKTIHVSDGITSIGNICFLGFSALTNVSLSDSVTLISSSAFKDCNSLKEIKLSQKLTEISSTAFMNCKNLQNITFPETLTSIDEQAFKDCSSLKNIDIPNSVTHLGKSTFEGCTNLKSASVSGSLNDKYYYSRKYTYDKEYYYGLTDSVFQNCTSLETVIFKKGNSLNCIGNNSFKNCSKLKNITFSNTIEVIGNNAFYMCSDLSEVNLPSSIQILQEAAFKSCTNLKKVQFPANTFCDIKDAAFQNCSNLENIRFSGKVGKDAFNGCTNLKKVIISNTQGYSISDRAFKNCKNLTSLTLPDNPDIGEETFSGCSKLKNISLPHGVFHMGRRAFYNCSSLQSIVLSKDFNTIENEEFIGCKSLRSITFLFTDPNYGICKRYPSIAKTSVKGCSNLKIIYGYKYLQLEYVAKNLGAKFVALDKAPATPVLTVSPGKNTVKVSWKKSSDSEVRYELDLDESRNFSSYHGTQYFSGNSSPTFTYKNLTPGKTYYLRIRACKMYATNCYSKWSTPKAVTVLPIKVLTASAPALKSGKQYFRASWKKTSGTSGYQIQYSLYKNFKKPVTRTLTGNTKTSITVSRLKRQKRYYVRVRAYRNANFKKYYGKWSKTKSIVVK